MKVVVLACVVVRITGKFTGGKYVNILECGFIFDQENLVIHRIAAWWAGHELTADVLTPQTVRPVLPGLPSVFPD
jgi:hypothetical protein